MNKSTYVSRKLEDPLKFRYKITLVLVSFATFFLAPELGLRVYVKMLSKEAIASSAWIETGIKFDVLKCDYLEPDPLLWWKLKIKKTETVVNSLHTRGNQFSIRKKPGVFRIVCIGDSCTYGALISNDKDTYCKVLEKMLNSGTKSSKYYEVINAGVPGYSSYQALLYLQKIIVTWKPDLVSVYIGNNNDSSINRYFNIEPQVRWSLLMHINNFLEHSYLYNLMESLFLKLKIGLLKRTYKDYLSQYHRSRYELSKIHLVKMTSIAKENGFKIIFLNYPTLTFGKESLGRDCETNRWIAKAAQEAKVPLVDIIKALQMETGKILFFDMVHPNITGHRVIARTIFNFLLDEGIALKENYTFEKDNF